MKLSITFLKLVLAASLVLPQWARTVDSKPLSIRLVPRKISLWGVSASQRFLVLAKYADGLERDVTAEAQLSLSIQALGRIEGSRLVALADGKSALAARYKGQSANAEVDIHGMAENRPFSFASDIGGILTKRGCNGNNCHASVKGKGGLKLSADATAPKEDYRWIVEGGMYHVLSDDVGPKAPRIDRAKPENSLILLKPTMSVPHGGGLRFRVGSPDYETVLNWVRAGAPYGAEEQSGTHITSLEVLPRQTILDLQGKQQLLVIAHLSNGSDEDLTDQVMYVSNNPDVVKVSEGGLVEPMKAGETAVLIRAAGHALSAEFGVVQNPVADYPEVPRRNFIDEYVFSKLRKLNIVPSRLSSDAEFLRRVCLDLAGTLPPPERLREFLASRDPNKRDKLIETLLNSPEYVDYWTFRFSDLLRVTHNSQASPRLTQAYADWVRNSIAQNKPYDQIARERIAGQGFVAPVRDYYHISDLIAPQSLMAEQARIFLGRRLDCAQCHNHPFEIWTQSQFWGLTAFFGRVTELRDYSAIIDSPHGGRQDENENAKVVHPRTKQEVQPMFLDGTHLPLDNQDDPRMKLADWMTASPYFAEAAVNRIWGYFFDRGIVEPVDDFRSTNPPTNPELLAALAKDFREHGYDLKRVIRLIAQSRTYQLSGVANTTNAHDEVNYSRALPRPMEAAVLLDAISRVTGVDEEFSFHKATGAGGSTPGALAVSMIPEVCPSQFLDAYGRSMRQAPPSAHPEPSLLQALHMWAGPTYTTKISKPGGRVDRLFQSGAGDRQIIEEFYLAAFSRLPTPGELDALQSFIGKRSSRRQAVENFVWALISSREFAYNH